MFYHQKNAKTIKLKLVKIISESIVFTFKINIAHSILTKHKKFILIFL